MFAQDNVYRIFIGESQYNVLKEQYVEGSVELINGKKIKGLINKNLTEPILKVINGDTATYNGNEIKEFKLKDQSKIISTIVNGKQMFLQTLPISKEGLIKVYTYDQIIIEENKTSGSNFFTNPIEYNRVVRIYFEKNGKYIQLNSSEDVHSLVGDNQETIDYIENFSNVDINNLNGIIRIIEIYNVNTN